MYFRVTYPVPVDRTDDTDQCLGTKFLDVCKYCLDLAFTELPSHVKTLVVEGIGLAIVPQDGYFLSVYILAPYKVSTNCC